MRMTVLGKSPSWQDAGGACSGYLIEEGGTRLLLDCGNGVFGKMREHVDYVDVEAVVISHLHPEAAARAGPPLAWHRPPGAAAADRSARRPPDLPPRGRRLGQRRPDRASLRDG